MDGLSLGTLPWTLLAAVAVISLAVVAILRRVDVRLALFLAALALGALAGNPMAIVRRFLITLADEKFVVPICTAMGFAHVLRHTQCDQHLVHLLVRPLERVRGLLIPGTVVVGFLVNVPIISQTSTAVTIGAVLIPLLLAARIAPVTIGAALLLGASVGGELLNPGAPELRTVVEESARAARALGEPTAVLTGKDCVDRIWPLALLQLAVATVAFWVLSLRAAAHAPVQEGAAEAGPLVGEGFRINLLKALVPLVPLLLLFLTAPPFELLPLPRGWLVEKPDNPAELLRFDSRLIGAAMLAGSAVATLAAWRAAGGVATAFFEGAGYAFTHIISLIVTAACFGEGVESVGLAEAIGRLIVAEPGLLFPLAGLLPWGFAVLSGSGMASTQSLFGFFAESAVRLHTDPAHVGAVVSLTAAAGRTMSPVAAVTLMCATMTGTSPVEIVKRVAPPLILGAAAVVLVALATAS